MVITIGQRSVINSGKQFHVRNVSMPIKSGHGLCPYFFVNILKRCFRLLFNIVLFYIFFNPSKNPVSIIVMLGNYLKALNLAPDPSSVVSL